jgi:LCP family protein required for cell wall assembly
MKKVLLWILGIVVILLAGLSAFGYYKVHSVTSKVYQNTTTSKTSDAKTKASESVSYLLLGTDTGELGRSYKGRTDTMMVMTVNPTTKTTTLVSLQRDTLISINGADAKLNAAYAYGSADSAISAVENLLDIKLDGYLLVNMEGLEQLVDSVGGVTVTSPMTFTFEGYTFTEGQSTALDGAKALAFSRMRHEDPEGDYGRQKRQQLVIQAVINKLKDNPTSVLSDSFLSAVSDNVRTNVSLTSVRNLATKYSAAASTIKTDQMVGSGQMIDGVSYQIMSNEEISRVHNEIVNAQKN